MFRQSNRSNPYHVNTRQTIVKTTNSLHGVLLTTEVHGLIESKQVELWLVWPHYTLPVFHSPNYISEMERPICLACTIMVHWTPIIHTALTWAVKPIFMLTCDRSGHSHDVTLWWCHILLPLHSAIPSVLAQAQSLCVSQYVLYIAYLMLYHKTTQSNVLMSFCQI